MPEPVAGKIAEMADSFKASPNSIANISLGVLQVLIAAGLIWLISSVTDLQKKAVLQSYQLDQISNTSFASQDNVKQDFSILSNRLGNMKSIQKDHENRLRKLEADQHGHG